MRPGDGYAGGAGCTVHVDTELIQQVSYGIGLVISTVLGGGASGWVAHRRLVAREPLAKEDPTTPRSVVERIAALEAQLRTLEGEVDRLREAKHDAALLPFLKAQVEHLTWRIDGRRGPEPLTLPEPKTG